MAEEPLRSARWGNAAQIPQRQYSCGFCGSLVGPDQGYLATQHNKTLGHIYICTYCRKPTFFAGEKQTPGALVGNKVSALEDNVESIFHEARTSFAAGAFTGVVLRCRKILMHIAVDKGAKVRLRYIEYVDWLDKNGWVPPGGKAWVAEIKDRGN